MSGSSPPSLTQFSPGIGTFNAAWANGVVQGAAVVSSLRAFVGISGMNCWIVGTTTQNDGGQGMFVWNSTSTATDDDGVTTIAANGVATGRWRRQVQPNQFITPQQYGAIGDGVADDTVPVNLALSAAHPGQAVMFLPPYKYLINSGNVVVPAGVGIWGFWNVPDTTNNSVSGAEPLNLATLYGAIILNPTYTIILNSSSSIRGVPIYRSGLVIGVTSSAAFSGTAITIHGDATYIGYTLVLGFNQLSTSTGQVRGKYEWVYGDNQNGIYINNAYDTPYLHHCHMWPWVTYNATNPTSDHWRTGVAYEINGTALASLAHLFCYGYYTGYSISGSGGPTLVDCQSDGPSSLAGTTGFVFGDGTNGVNGAKVIGCTSFSLQSGYTVNLPAGDWIDFINSSSSSQTSGWNILGGLCTIIGGFIHSFTTGVNVEANNSAVVLIGFRPINMGGALINNTGGTGSIYISPDCDFSQLAPGDSITTNMVLNTCASASPLLLPTFGNSYLVTGTTGFTIISGGWAGRQVTMTFTGALTITDSTAASGVRLTNGANFTTTAGSSLSLIFNGNNWVETGRCT